MNLKSESKTLSDSQGDIEVTTTQFPAMKSFGLLAKLAKTVGPALGALMKLDPKTEISASVDGLAAAFSELDADTATRLVPEILAGTTVTLDGKMFDFTRKENIDLVFSGRLGLMFQTLGHALQVNYRDFSAGSDPAAPSRLGIVGA